MNKPKIVLVGAGRFGMNHLRVWKELEKAGICTLAGVADPRSDVLKNTKNNFDVQVSLSLNGFLKENVDAFDIVTPTDTHFCLASQCLNAGKHVFVEKPLTANFTEAATLVQIARGQNRILMVGHIFRYNSAIRRIKEFIQNGDLGKIYYLFGHFMGIKDPRVDMGALYNYAVHHVDAYNYLLGELPNEVNCVTGYFLGRKEFEDVAILTMKYPSGFLGIVEGSWLPPGKQRDLTIVGSRKSATSDLLEQTLTLHESYVEKIDNRFKVIEKGATKVNVEFKEPLRLELLDFINSINTGQKALADDQSALDVIRILEKALESARIGKSVRID